MPAPTKMTIDIIHVHAILATLSWGLFFPLGAILVRVVTKQSRNVHWMMQTFGMLTFTTAFGLGAYLATKLHLWVTFNGHAIIGTTLFGLLWMMPILGILHRYDYISTHNSYKFAWVHVYLGRVLILAGVINGGLGLQLGYYEAHLYPLHQGQIAYGVVAGFIALSWIAVSIAACVRSKGDVNVGSESGPKVQGLGYLRNNSQDTAATEDAALEKEKYEGVGAGALDAPAQTQAQTHTTTTTTTTSAGPSTTVAHDIVHGGAHDQTRLADVIDPAVRKSENTTMFT